MANLIYLLHNTIVFIGKRRISKFDLLGLKTLTVIDKTLRRLKAKNINLEISKINQSDEKVFSLLSTGEQLACFSRSTQAWKAIKQMKPNKFDDIIALALYRPGP